MYRKHMNSCNILDIKKHPFYSWQCLTISLANKDIDLIVTDERCMTSLLKLLVYKIRTLDGVRETADQMVELMV